jgi:ABC-2 type transport system permease protein
MMGLKFISMAFQRQAAYRVEYFTGVLNAFLYIFIFTSIWKALIPAGHTMNGMSQETMVAYAVLGTIIKVSFARNDTLLGNRVKTGEIAVDLMKPYSIPFMLLCDTLGTSLFHFLARALPLLFFSIFFFNIDLSVPLSTLFKFSVTYILSFALFFLLTFLISSMAFYFVEVFPFWIFYYALITLASGAIIPLDFFPDFWKKLLLVTPFPYLFYFPSITLLGKTGLLTFPQVLGNYMLQIFAAAFLSWLAYFFGLRRLSIAGG